MPSMTWSLRLLKQRVSSRRARARYIQQYRFHALLVTWRRASLVGAVGVRANCPALLKSGVGWQRRDLYTRHCVAGMVRVCWPGTPNAILRWYQQGEDTTALVRSRWDRLPTLDSADDSVWRGSLRHQRKKRPIVFGSEWQRLALEAAHPARLAAHEWHRERRHS